MAGFGCCDSNPAAIAGRNVDVTNYYNAGGTIEIGNYDGDAGWDFLVGGSNNSAWVAGVGGRLTGPSCTDGETVTALGISNGFTQPGPVGCWTHQAYNQTYFGALGFTKSYFDADPAFAASNPGTGAYSSLLSNGNTITGGGNVPEPAAWTMMIMGFGLIGATMRRRVARVTFG
ncbi:PEP-CTERM sorting domain-containing protein [Polymorphobacter arshaanensis]|uniref:PEP-CTERM sorting domain-containing protein n=2 Tax=Glacieibacterium arshaanense TaxID=2511025 RepID=A0A4Y9EPC8_9SPHN|nr:PEP-CTERM sorting domain-containing protein [Polymorphobacter arshaanensis]